MNNPMKKIGLIVFDLDGTVLDGNREITPRTIRAFEKAHASGHILAVSTGRAISMVPGSIQKLGCVDYIITSNGSCIRRVKDGEVLFHSFLEKSIALEVFYTGKQKNAAFNIFFEDRVVFELKSVSYMLKGLSRFSWKERGQLNEMRKNIHHVFSARHILQSSQASIEKMGCSFKNRNDCETVLKMLEGRGNVNAVRTLDSELEITACGISKGSSLDVLCKLLHIDNERVVAFGDGGNDLSMMESAGCFVAMGNSSPEVKAAAKFITGTVSEDGVARWLEQYLEVE